MNIGSLFSGIGGLDLGLERAGMTVRWQSEIDPYASRVLAKHWPHVPNLGDITLIDWSEVEPVDLICGGYPCQPFSLAGARGGDTDRRHLWPHFARAIRDLRPRYALLENVPGHLSLGFGRVLGDLAELGYDAEWECIPAAAVGAPHLRYRVFVVAHDTARVRGWGEARLDRRVLGVVPDANCTTLRNEPVPISGSCCASVPGLNGKQRHVAHPSHSIGRENRQGADARGPHHEREPRGTVGTGRTLDSWWAVEPDVGRVAHGIPPELDGGLDAHPDCITQARSTGVANTHRLRTLRHHLAATTPPSGHQRCAYCGHPLSAVPCRGACPPWQLGSRGEEVEDLRCLREGVLQLLTLAGEDVQPYLSVGGWTSERPQTVGRRVDRLRTLGNAVVPQVAEWIGRQIMAAAA